MKLVNYYRGANTRFDCVIHGTIYMTNQEWSDAVSYIARNKKLLDYYGSNHLYQMFLEDTKRVIHGRTHDLYNIRVTATEVLVKRFGLSKYKRGNYQIAVERKSR